MQVLTGNAPGIVIVEDDKLPVRSAVNIGFNAEIAAVSRCNKGCGSVFALKTAYPAMGNHAYAVMLYFAGIHNYSSVIIVVFFARFLYREYNLKSV